MAPLFFFSSKTKYAIIQKNYWRINYDYDPLDDNTGTSYAILNNSKASSFFEDAFI